MGLWHRLRELDHRIVAGSGRLRLADPQVQAWWDGLTPRDQVAVWNAARADPPEDPQGVRAWVLLLEARTENDRRWSRWSGGVTVLALVGLVWLTAAFDEGLTATLPAFGAVVAVPYGRVRVRAQLERRRGDLLAWLLER